MGIDVRVGVTRFPMLGLMCFVGEDRNGGVGAWRGLQHTIRQPTLNIRRIWLCIDSTLVIWGLRGDAPSTSQRTFLECHNAMETHHISIKWAPGHLGIEGNEIADRLA